MDDGRCMMDKTADGFKEVWTKAQLLPEGLSADGAALSQWGAEASIYDLDDSALRAEIVNVLTFCWVYFLYLLETRFSWDTCDVPEYDKRTFFHRRVVRGTVGSL